MYLMTITEEVVRYRFVPLSLKVPNEVFSDHTGGLFQIHDG